MIHEMWIVVVVAPRGVGQLLVVVLEFLVQERCEWEEFVVPDGVGIVVLCMFFFFLGRPRATDTWNSLLDGFHCSLHR